MMNEVVVVVSKLFQMTRWIQSIYGKTHIHLLDHQITSRFFQW